MINQVNTTADHDWIEVEDLIRNWIKVTEMVYQKDIHHRNGTNPYLQYNYKMKHLDLRKHLSKLCDSRQ